MFALRFCPYAILLCCTCVSADIDTQASKACDYHVLLAIHRRIDPAVSRIAGIHWNFTSSRHYEVVELMSVFQVDQLLRSALRFAESLRMVFSTLACPSRGLLERGRSVEPMTGDQTSINDLPEGFRLLDHVDKFLSNVRYLTSAGGDVAMSQAQITLDQPERELREVSNRLQTWLKLAKTK